MCPSRYPIELECEPTLGQAQRDSLGRAAERWSRCIADSLPSVEVGERVVSGLLVRVRTAALDARGGVFGRAGPTELRPEGAARAGFLPAVAEMILDIDDLSELERDGRFESLVSHEIGHSLGLGTDVWVHKGLVRGIGTADPTFHGPAAMAELSALTGRPVAPVPLENHGGRGVANVHWREEIFGDELMSSYVLGKRNPLSRLTLAALGDLGYDVDLDAADDFALPARNVFRSLRGVFRRFSGPCHLLTLPAPTILPEDALRE